MTRKRKQNVVKHEDLAKAHNHWCAYHGLVEIEYQVFLEDFMIFIGCDIGDLKWVDPRSPEFLVTVPSERTVQYVKALCSPHWYTLLKAHYARTQPSIDN